MDQESSATCKKCGLTARNQIELRDHINHAHGNNRTSEIGSENSTADRKII